MALQVANLLLCVTVWFFRDSQGLQFTLDLTPVNGYCGHLDCSVDVSQNDTRILSVVGLTISRIGQASSVTKLVSLSVFDMDIHLETPTVGHILGASGSITHNHGNLVLYFVNETDCLSGLYMCELDFINVSGLPDVIKETVSPSGQCPTTVNELGEITTLIKAHSDDVDRQLTELSSQNTDMEGKLTAIEGELAVLRSQNVAMETKLDQVLEQLSRLQGAGNSSQQINRTISCVKGEPHDEPREKFLLWERVPALCDTETDGGGWVIIQRRTTGDVDFYKGWDDYKKGFGTPDTDYWLGNDNIHNLISQGYTNLRVDMEYQGEKYFAEYSSCNVADLRSDFNLTVSGYHGNATDALSPFSGLSFSTFDRDNDIIPGNCAIERHGAWWYSDCSFANLNGMWGAQNYSGFRWDGIYTDGSLAASEMKIRQV